MPRADAHAIRRDDASRGLADLGVVNIESLGLGFAEVTARTIANAEDDVFFLCLQLEGRPP